MRRLFLIFLFFNIHSIYSQSKLLSITPDGISDARKNITNPELDFLISFEDTSFEYDLTKQTVCKINFDFNYDGIEDVALTDLDFWGAHIGPWAIYLGKEKHKYLFVGELWFHNDAVRFDSLSKGKSKVTVFARAGGSSVDIVEYLLSKEGINQIKRKTLNFENFEKMNVAFKRYINSKH